MRSLKRNCAWASRTHIGSKYDSEERGEDVDHCKAVGQQRTCIEKPLQEFDCSINMCCMLDDSSLFHVAFEAPLRLHDMSSTQRDYNMPLCPIPFLRATGAGSRFAAFSNVSSAKATHNIG